MEAARGLSEVKTEMLKRNREAREHIQVDEKGEPVFDEKVPGEFTALVVKIREGGGLKEFGRV